MANEKIYEHIREAIATGALQPDTRLVEADLMARYSASRPAVRQALLRLEHEGLVEQRKNSSARVRLIGRQEALEIYQARSLIESQAAKLAAARITDSQIDALDSMAEQAAQCAPAEALMFETRFHQAILEIAGDGTLQRLHASLHGHFLRYHHYTQLITDWSANSPCEHRAIVEALRRHDGLRAAEAMRDHLDRLTATLERVFDRYSDG
ncbi:GntR family transcriptional regulator [Stakelama sp. CBK3Z-3]|uniref:GntR family transcriptional regulator n=1 Tax=Stakelama flava TaxID=2860338 RepID=A0ABS6XLV3_9SPHN|nr:GntR family transcriptional regulator [Stakelama flava]MBW4330778.1 GntR family transcriptional regulator [Stakelama flava]